MFEEIFLKNNDIVDKEEYDALYRAYKEISQTHEKLKKRMDTILKISDKQLLKHRYEVEDHTKQNKRLNLILKQTDRASTKVLREKTELEVELEKELELEKFLLKEIEDTQKEVVYTMGAIGETRSKETGNHVKRVAEYSRCLAKYYGLNEEEINCLGQASPMHDIGKVATPDAILNKPGRLTIDEFEIMKQHAQTGYEMLKHSKRLILKSAAIVAHEHHEKYDGSGYPRGLKGEEIHIFGRITALADVFDALGSERVYKKAWSDEEIFAMFREESGKHFDPKLIDIFFNNVDDFVNIRNLFKDT